MPNRIKTSVRFSARTGVNMRGSAANTSSRVPWPTMKNERPGGRQNSLSRAQLIIKAAVGTVKLSRSAIRELREWAIHQRYRFQGPRFRARSGSEARREKARGRSAGWPRVSKINCRHKSKKHKYRQKVGWVHQGIDMSQWKSSHRNWISSRINSDSRLLFTLHR